MAIILITGGTGLVGKALSNRLISEGHEVRILSRNPKSLSKIKSFFWDVKSQKIDESAFDNVEHIIHLAGAGIADSRWTEARKKEIIDSRVNSMTLITSVVKKKQIQLKSFVGASAIGIYGMITSNKIFSETDLGNDDFLTYSCLQWEKSYEEIEHLTQKKCILRIGIVLSDKGGALAKLLPIFKLGLGSPTGSGLQYMPWIHLDDLVSIFHQALFNPKLSGLYNAVAPDHVTNREFSEKLAESLSKPFFMPSVPEFMLHLIFGEMANILLKGSRISDQKLLNSNFVFQYPTLSEALKSFSLS